MARRPSRNTTKLRAGIEAARDARRGRGARSGGTGRDAFEDSEVGPSDDEYDDDAGTEPGSGQPGPGRPATTERRELQVIQRDTGEVVHRVAVTGKTDKQIEAEAAKLRAKINEEEFYIEDTGGGEVG